MDPCQRDARCHSRPLQAGGAHLPPHCVISVDNAVSYLEQQHLSTQAAAVFVAAWPVREADAKRLMVGKIVTVASLDLVCSKVCACMPACMPACACGRRLQHSPRGGGMHEGC